MPTIRTTATIIPPTPCSRCSIWLHRLRNLVPECRSLLLATRPTSRASSPFNSLRLRRRPLRCPGVRRSCPTTGRVRVSATLRFPLQPPTRIPRADPLKVQLHFLLLPTPTRGPSRSATPAAALSRLLTRLPPRLLTLLRHLRRCRRRRPLPRRARRELPVARDRRAGLLRNPPKR